MSEVGPISDVEKRSAAAIQLTRNYLNHAIKTPSLMIIMAAECVDPEDIEDLIAEILEYLEKTEPEEEG